MSAPPFRSASKILHLARVAGEMDDMARAHADLARHDHAHVELADAHMDQRLGAHRLDDLDRARNGPLRCSSGEA